MLVTVAKPYLHPYRRSRHRGVQQSRLALHDAQVLGRAEQSSHALPESVVREPQNSLLNGFWPEHILCPELVATKRNLFHTRLAVAHQADANIAATCPPKTARIAVGHSNNWLSVSEII
jgi:hypothetical protein